MPAAFDGVRQLPDPDDARLKAITQVVGYMILENGIFLFGLPAAGGDHKAEIGVLLDLVVGDVRDGDHRQDQIHRTFSTIDMQPICRASRAIRRSMPCVLVMRSAAPRSLALPQNHWRPCVLPACALLYLAVVLVAADLVRTQRRWRVARARPARQAGLDPVTASLFAICALCALATCATAATGRTAGCAPSLLLGRDVVAGRDDTPPGADVGRPRGRRR
ncbi:MAG: hypothetical protein U1E73_09375 [Planctomycetota bacterium]